jgi:hypothetical protein
MNYYPLTLPITNPLNPNFVFPDVTSIPDPWTIWLPEAKDILSDEVFAWFKEIKSMPHFVHLFYGKAGRECKIHTDGIKNPVPAAINWVLSGQSSEMIWYDPLTEGNIEYVTGSKREHIYWLDNEVTEIARHQITVPTLVRTDIPHKTVNNSNEDRWCLSVRFWPGKPWNKTVDMLADYIKPL